MKYQSHQFRHTGFAAGRARAHNGRARGRQYKWAGWAARPQPEMPGSGMRLAKHAGQGALLRHLQAKRHQARQQREVAEALHSTQQAGGAGGQAAAGLGLEGGEEGWRMELGGMRCCGC